MKNFLKIFMVICVIILALIGIVFFVLSNQSKDLEINFGDDAIPTLYSALGEIRSVIKVGTGIENGISYKIVEYKPEEISTNDINQYLEKLVKEWFLVTRNDETGVEIELAKESIDVGQIIMVTIHSDSLETYIRYLKGVGTLTKY